jgi:16S rRNA (adenine1518-N6/adenine1519-N6)-dimethyltransferase
MKAKKSLGQNFLKSELALKKIIEAGEIKPSDVILEIGPGKGALTEKLLESVHPTTAGQGLVIAVEKDRRLFEMLKEKFAEQIKLGSFVLVHGDILEFEITNYELRNYKVIANIPYNITGAILKKFLTAKRQPSSIVLMVQHEVAKRILATDKKESILSVSVKAYGEPKMVMKVPARYFSPRPLVDSAIISIKNISRKTFVENKIDEEKFWEIVKAGFAHKRKKLSNNLKNLINYTGFAPLALENKRAENLTLTDWVNLAK